MTVVSEEKPVLSSKQQLEARTGSSGETPTVFISYAREDEPFADTLGHALQEKGIDVKADWDLSPGERYKEPLRSLILGSHALLFVISPDSADSEECKKEIDFANEQKKPILPVLRRDLTDSGVLPGAVADPQWVYLRDTDDFEKGIAGVAKALKTDFDLLPEHRRLGVDVDNWLKSGQSRSYLLKGDALKKAEEWLAKVSAYPEKLPQPTPLISEYILASQQARRRNTHVGFGIGIAVVLALLVLTI